MMQPTNIRLVILVTSLLMPCTCGFDFQKWASQMGVIDSNLLEIRSASFDKNQFALHALRPISKHQTLITLPSNAYFSGSSFASTPGGIAAKKLLQEVGLWNPSDENRQMLLISLAASAANDDNPSSILAPYVRNVLPKNFTTPTTWSEDAMEVRLSCTSAFTPFSLTCTPMAGHSGK